MIAQWLKDNPRLAAATGGAAALALFILAALAVSGARPDFIVLTAALLALCGVLAFDIILSRRREAETSATLRTLSAHHDRLVREVARNRNSIGIVRDALAAAARDVMAQGRALPAAASAEAKMIETIVARMATLDTAPRANTSSTTSAVDVSDILELEMAPPPRKDPPLSALDQELSAMTGRISEAAMANLVRHAARNDDAVGLFLQPIVSLPQRKPRLYEALGRIRGGAGVWLPAGRYMDAARREALAPALDNLFLLRCLETLRDERSLTADTPVIVNVTAATLQDKGFMGDLVAFLSRNRGMAARLVFEMTQEEIETMNLPLIAVVNGLAQLGCRFSMDGVRARRVDVNLLKNRHVRYIKFDGAWLAKEGASREGFLRVIRMKRTLDAAGIDLIAEKVESESMLRGLLDYGIELGQGWLFGKPDNVVAFRKPAETKKVA